VLRGIERLGELRAHRLSPVAGTVFPNLSYLVPVLFPSVRVWHPRGPEAVDIHAWCIVDRSAPEEVKADIATTYLRNFGPGGMFEMDDSENWQLATRANRGWVTRRGHLHVGMGLGHERVEPELPGVTGDLISESNARAFHRRWRSLMAAPGWPDIERPMAPDEVLVHIERNRAAPGPVVDAS
jgi:3-phenylpropionate/trans-cinnamate dioxygenase alpha subunit